MNNYNYNNYNGPSPGPGPGRERPPQGGDSIETVSWLIGVALIFGWFPVGLFLTIAHATGRDFVGNILRSLSGKAGAARAGDASTARAYRRQRAAEKAAEPPKRQRAQAREEKKREETQQAEKPEPGVRRADAGAALKTVFGWLLAAFGIFGALGAAEIWPMLTCIAVALGGGALVLSGHASRKKEAAFRRCINVSGTAGVVNIAKLSKTLGLEGAEADRLLTEMIDRGYYGARAYIDHERGLLVIQPEEMRDVYRAEDEARARAAEKAKAEPAQTAQSVYDQYVEKIRQADVDIEDEVMSEKIRRMQTVTAAIFQEVEAHPEKKPQIQRFMNYYLPTTLKLLNSYARIEAQGVTGENMAKAKADIERIADTLVEGYEKQLDTLYRSEAVDIAGDVNVIENMMKRDGLAGQSDFKPFGEAGGQTMGGH